MANVKANLSFDATKGTVVVTIEPIGQSEMEHELLARFFNSPRQVSLVPFTVNDRLETRFVIEDKFAFPQAQRATENRIRLRDGRPTVEQEWNRNKTPAEIAQREQANKAAQAEGFMDADHKQSVLDGKKRDEEFKAKQLERSKTQEGLLVADTNEDKAARAAGYDNAADRDFKLKQQLLGYEGNYKFAPKDVPAVGGYTGAERRIKQMPVEIERRAVDLARPRNGQPTVEQEEARNAANRPAQTVGHQLQNEANKQLTPPPPYSPKKVN